jgi:branched-subunit amino acid ABC-type transport system permease component
LIDLLHECVIWLIKETSLPGLLASVADGLLLGFVYGVAAMGLTLIWGVMEVINLSHGATMALGMFTTYLLFTGLGLNPYLALLVVAVLGLAFGFLVYGVAVQRVIGAPHLSSLLATFAVEMIIIGVGTAILTTSPRNIDFTLGSVQIGPLILQGTRLVAALAAILLGGALYLFLYHTPPGKAIRAVANNRPAAELMGIPSAQILALSFGLGTMLAAVAGGLVSTFFPFTLLSGGTYQTKSFVICVLGGLGNPMGALIGGLVLGLLEGLVPGFMPVSWVPVVEFVLFVLVLILRPNGILGVRQ